VPDLLEAAGGLRPGVAEEVARETGVPAADVYGVASFFHLLSQPEAPVRVCQGLSCALAGSAAMLEAAKASGLPATGCSCLAACDLAPAALAGRTMVPSLTRADLGRAEGSWSALQAAATSPPTIVGPAGGSDADLPIALASAAPPPGQAFALALERGAEAVVEEIADSGLQGRGGAGFPAGLKWRSVLGQADPVRYVVLNADEGEPGTFKDREILCRQPGKVVEGLAIAAWAVGASDVYCYLRGEFDRPWAALEGAIDAAGAAGLYPGIRFHMHAGHGAYICGEETALLEALEGKRGMPRLKPPYPTERGLWGHPTLVHNVETIACVPAVVQRGSEWFAGLGRTGAGTKLYCISGHVARPGTYELPLGVSLDELVDAAGGYIGELHAFSPGGASSGFLPASERERALDFRSLQEVGSMLGSAGVVVLNTTADLREAVRVQLAFFEDESCGQCAPCRIGTQFLHSMLLRSLSGEASEAVRLDLVEDVARVMEEGSICGLGVAAPLPLTSLLRWFPDEIGKP